MRRASLVVVALAAIGLARGAIGCATASQDTGTPRDSCKRRDCGPTYGNGGSYFPGDDADDFPIEEAAPPDDTAPPDDLGVDTSVAPDAPLPDAPADAPADAKPDAVADAKPDALTDAKPDAPSCSVPSGATCALAPQCGCSASQTCDLASAAGATRCVTAGTKKLGEACAAAGACGLGLTCFGGICQKLCAGSADCAGITAAVCSAIAPGAKACLSQCDLRTPATVCGALNCTLIDGAKGITACIAAGASYNGCTANFYACAPRYACVPDSLGTGNVCLRWCRVGIDADCPTGKVCYAYSDHPAVAGVEFGICDF
jgi:hypothetical protein